LYVKGNDTKMLNKLV